MTKPLYPTFDIRNLDADKLSDEILNADRFEVYLSRNPHLQVVHKHTFYHLVFFTGGSGSHTIDFESFPVKPGMMYFMRPGQVHNWHFEGPVTGYTVNFSPLFFTRYLGEGLADQFSFFDGRAAGQVKFPEAALQQEIVALFEALLKEKEAAREYAPLMIGTLLLQLFVKVARTGAPEQPEPPKAHYNRILLRRFEQLVETHFRTLKLPKAYAVQLHVTPAHLNAVCREQLDRSAGEVIRDRVVLEAQRLLVNFELSVSAVALELNFPDASYFVKFFKKYTGLTPEAFRKKHFSGTDALRRDNIEKYHRSSQTLHNGPVAA